MSCQLSLKPKLSTLAAVGREGSLGLTAPRGRRAKQAAPLLGIDTVKSENLKGLNP